MEGESEPSNWASQLTRELFHLNGDPDHVRQNIDAYFNPEFVREDRRRLVGFPNANRDDFVEQLRAWQEVNNSPAVFTVQQIVAVRGERCVLARARVTIGDSWTEFLTIGRVDVDGRTEKSVIFDPDEEEAAIAELERVHNEIAE